LKEMHHDRTHIDLFTGLAGFSVAAAVNGVRTVAMCECDEFLAAGLGRAWPGVPVCRDVRKFDGRAYRRAWILTAGTPCQPASRAGEQRGAADDRWLWPETLRVLAESEPAWALFENPPGILDVGLDGILAEMGRLGYEVQPISVPACAVNSPQDRERIWVVGHRVEARLERRGPKLQQGAGERDGFAGEPTQSGALAHSELPERRQDAEPRGRAEQGSHGGGQAAGGLAEPAQGGSVEGTDKRGHRAGTINRGGSDCRGGI